MTRRMANCFATGHSRSITVNRRRLENSKPRARPPNRRHISCHPFTQRSAYRSTINCQLMPMITGLIDGSSSGSGRDIVGAIVVPLSQRPLVGRGIPRT